MMIDGWDIGNARARQSNVVWGYHEITNSSMWVAGSRIPAMVPNRAGWKPLKLVLVVKGEGREGIRENVGKILARLMEPVEIILDRFSHRFTGILKSYSTEESSKNNWHALTLNLVGYEHGMAVSGTGSTSMSIYNPGTVDSPAVLRLTTTVGKAAILIGGLGDEILLEDIPADTEVRIDGESGVMTLGASLLDAGLFSLPCLRPGRNTITCDQSTVTMTVAFKPRYM